MDGGYTIVSIDLGSNVGWSICRDGVIKHSGVAGFGAKDAHPGHRFLKFHNWLSDFHTVDEIIYEDVPRFESAGWAKVYCGLLSILQMFCLTHGIRLTCIKAKSVKKEFTGNGNSDKKAMCEVCHKMGWKNGHPNTDLDHDEADAIATMVVVLQRRGVDARLYE